MKRTMWILGIAALSVVTLAGAAEDIVAPKVSDALRRVELDGRELGGELNRRILDLVYKNYMVLNLDADWLNHFRHREVRGDRQFVYYGIGKVMDAGSLFAAYTHDPAVAARTQYLIDELRKTRDADGYLGFWTVEPNNHQNLINWILHEQEYINLALTRHFRTTGNPESLADARAVADYIMKSFPLNEYGVYHIPVGISIAGICEGFVELYRLTGDEKYWDYAQRLQYEPHWIYEPFDGWADKIPGRPFHLYVMISHLYPETQRYRLNGDETLLLKSRWMQQELLEQGHGALLITGSSSQGEHFTYNQEGAGQIEESCVTAYLLRLFDSLMRLDGDMRIGNVMERTIYNALFAAQEPNGRHICYFTPFSGKREFQSHDTFCCNGNFRRAVAEIPQKVFYRTPDDGIALNLYSSLKKSFSVKGETFTITSETDYPTDGNVRLTFTATAPTRFAFRFRTPRWCEAMTATLNQDKPIEIDPAQQPLSYYEIDRVWRSGDVLNLSMPMTPRLVRGRETQAGRVALMRGPILFGLGETANPWLNVNMPWRNLVIDPTSFGKFEPDTSIRPGGLKVTARAWTNPEQTGEPIPVTFTEFVDPSGREIYFKIPTSTIRDGVQVVRVVDDEIFTQPRTTSEYEVLAACYGQKEAEENLPKLFEVEGKTLADLAADYVPSAGEKDRDAVFTSASGESYWSFFGVNNRRESLDTPGNATLLSSRFRVYATTLGYAYGQENPEELGFIANHAPSPHQATEWGTNFTTHALDQGIPATDRANWLFTHPLADPNTAVVGRWTPPRRHFSNGLLIVGSVMSRPSPDGISLEIVAQKSDGAMVSLEMLQTGTAATQTPVATVHFFKLLPPGEYTTIDFIVGNNGSFINDSTALKLRIVEPDAEVLQADVTAEVGTVFRGKIVTTMPKYAELFDKVAPGKTKTLKLKLRNRTTGDISYRQFSEDVNLEL